MYSFTKEFPTTIIPHTNNNGEIIDNIHNY
jgi:hypothetical protein